MLNLSILLMLKSLECIWMATDLLSSLATLWPLLLRRETFQRQRMVASTYAESFRVDVNNYRHDQCSCQVLIDHVRSSNCLFVPRFPLNISENAICRGLATPVPQADRCLQSSFGTILSPIMFCLAMFMALQFIERVYLRIGNRFQWPIPTLRICPARFH